MPEKFNPKDEQYKKVDDLPKEHQEEFVDIPQEIGGGFVRKEAMEALTEAEKVATIVNALKEQGLTSTDVLHEQALPMEKKRENALVDGENFEEFANDKEVVLKAVKRDGYNLQYASPELKNDKEFIPVAEYSSLLRLEMNATPFASEASSMVRLRNEKINLQRHL